MASPGEDLTTARCKEGCGPGVGGTAFPDAPASDPPHGEGSSGGRDSLGKSWRARKAGMEPLIPALGLGISTLSPLLQMRTIEVELKSDGIGRGCGWEIYHIYAASLLGRTP